MSNPSVLMLKELLRSVEAGEVTIVDCNLSSETEEATVEEFGGDVASWVKMTGRVDWWFTTQLGEQAETVTSSVLNAENTGSRISRSSFQTQEGFKTAIREQEWLTWGSRLLEAFAAKSLTGEAFLKPAKEALEALYDQHLNALEEDVASKTSYMIRRLHEAVRKAQK